MTRAADWFTAHCMLICMYQRCGFAPQIVVHRWVWTRTSKYHLLYCCLYDLEWSISVQYWCFTIRLFLRHSKRDILLLLLRKCDSQMFSELKKDVVLALELVLKDSSSLDFAVVRGLLPLMSDYQLDLLSDQVSYVHLYDIFSGKFVVYHLHACIQGSTLV